MRIVYNVASGTFGWSLLPGGGLNAGGRLVSCLFASVFTDALADPAEMPVELGPDRRGWWANGSLPVPMGSKLWLRRREKRNEPIRLLIKADVETALAWMTDGIAGASIAASVDVDVEFPDGTETVAIGIKVTEPNGVRHNWRIDDLWGTLIS